jgi:hypothetical protein
MKRPFSRIERRTLLGIVAALATMSGFACTPNNNVKSGAPVLTEIKIVENGGAAVTTIPATVMDCPGSTTSAGTEGGTSDSGAGTPRVAATGGMCDPSIAICRLKSANNWCRCVPNPPAAAPMPSPCMDAGAPDAGGVPDASAADASAPGASDAAAPLGGTWNCDPFSPDSVALFVFDRLLDTAPLDPGDAGAVTNVGMLTLAPPPPMPVITTADYTSNGSPNEVVFPLFGDFLSDGPSLLFAGQPELPENSAITIVLDGNKVRAKDGKTPFTAPGLFSDGTLTFTTGGFIASLSVPQPPALPADAGACTPPLTAALPDMTPATLTFDNPVDPTVVSQHITVTATPVAGGGGPVPVAFTATSTDGLNVSIVPAAMANWPASSVISITVDASTPDLLGETLGAPVMNSFTTSAM